MFEESWTINCFLWLNLAILGWTIAAYLIREFKVSDSPSGMDTDD